MTRFIQSILSPLLANGGQIGTARLLHTILLVMMALNLGSIVILAPGFTQVGVMVLAAQLGLYLLARRGLRRIRQEIVSRQQIEQDLQASREEYRKLLDMLPMAVVVNNFEGQTLYVNPAAVELVGAGSLKQLVGMSVWDFFAPETRAVLSRRLQRVQAGKVNQAMEYPMYRVDGQVIQIEARSIPVTYHNQPALLAVLRDVTESKEWEDTLLESERRYRELFDNNPHPMWLYDVETLAFMAVNLAAITHYGYTLDEFLSMTIKDMRPPEDVPHLLNEVLTPQRRFTSGKVWRHLKKDGTLIYVEISAHDMIFEGRPARMVVAYDVTRRKEAEDKLRQSEERFRLALSGSHITVFQQDRDLRYTWIYNPLTHDHEQDFILGRRDEDLLDPDEAAKLTALKQQVLDTGKGQRQEITTTIKGVTGHYDMAVEPLRDESGQIIGITCATVDITERKQFQQQRLETEMMRLEVEKQREVIQLRANFLATISHEFRTPLSIIQSSKDLLQRYYDRLTAEGRENHLQKIGEQVTYMVEMLEAVLMVSKMRTRGVDYQPTSMDVQAYCRDLVTETRLKDRGQHIITLIEHEPMAKVVIDENLLHHIIKNLLSNAVKYSPPGSEVQLETRQDGDDLVLIVRDQGVGIPAAEQSHVFDLFFRASNTSEIKGTGLGLAIVRTAVEACGGSIDFTSQEGAGTTFTVRLPLAPETVAAGLL